MCDTCQLCFKYLKKSNIKKKILNFDSWLQKTEPVAAWPPTSLGCGKAEFSNGSEQFTSLGAKDKQKEWGQALFLQNTSLGKHFS